MFLFGPLISWLTCSFIHKNNKHKNNDLEFHDAVNKFCDAVLGKGYDKLELWRQGKIKEINPNELDIINWNIYCRESSKRQFEQWKKENPEEYKKYFEQNSSGFMGIYLDLKN